eukprot:scpid62397/ scgid21065/ 
MTCTASTSTTASNQERSDTSCGKIIPVTFPTHQEHQPSNHQFSKIPVENTTAQGHRVDLLLVQQNSYVDMRWQKNRDHSGFHLLPVLVNGTDSTRAVEPE